MRKVSLRNIAAHKLRLALTVLAVVLGTAFISGAFMFTNSLSNTFDAAVDNAYRDVDAVVSAGENQPGVTLAQRDAIAEQDGVTHTNLTGSTNVVVATAGEEPEALQMGAGSASVGIWYAPEEVVGQPHELIEGQAPASANEVAINAAAAQRYELSVGDDVLLVDPVTRHEVTVTGIFDRPLDQAATLSLMTPEDAYLERYNEGDTVRQILVDGDAEADALVNQLQDEFPELTVEQGSVLADEASEAIQSALSFVNYFLVAFGLVALLVGTFLIANTFSMIVAQRTKEFALLRALGASRRQITRSVALEAVIVGVIGSALGIVAGIGLVALIKAIMAGQGMPLPGSGLGLSTSAVVVPLILGTLVTVVSAWAPARRAGKVEPVEAMRSSESATPQPLKVRTIIGLILMALGVVAAIAGAQFEEWATADRAWAVGFGALGLIVGFFLAGPALSLPIVPTFGRLIGLPFGAVGKLASTNSRRNPRRTSATAFALALGIALVTVIGMLGATMKASISDLLDSSFSSDYVLTGPTTGGFPLPEEVPAAAAEVDGVGSVITYRQAPVATDGVYGFQFGPHGVTDVVAGDPAEMVVLGEVEGTTDLSAGGMLASRSFADQHGWAVGDTLQLQAPGMTPDTTEVELKGIFEADEIFVASVVSQASVDEIGVPSEAANLLMTAVNGDGSVDHEQLRTNLEDELGDFLVVQVMDQEDLAGLAGESVNQMLYILYALLALAIVIAVLGIVNTLTLSVIERRQELGMLRAVGTQRRQVRTMIILESVQIAVFGAIAGILMGLFLGWMFLTVLSGEGLESPVIPWELLGIVLVGSLVVGVLAAIFPAQRAAKTPPLDAIAD